MNNHSFVNWSLVDLLLFLSLLGDLRRTQMDTSVAQKDDDQCRCPRVRCNCDTRRGQGMPFKTNVLEARFGRVF